MREHYCMTLTRHAPDKIGDGDKITLFVGSFVSMEPLKDGTCAVLTTNGLFNVKESEETIVSRAKGHNVIIKVGQV